MNERECEDKREREDENAAGDAGLDTLVRGTNVPQGTVVLAATPIGNTADASARLIALLERADIVAAEDTRRLYALANRLGVRVNGRVVATTIITSETSPMACLTRWKPVRPCWSCPTRACRPSTIRAWRLCVAPSNAPARHLRSRPVRRTGRAVPVRPADRPILLRRVPAPQAFRTRAILAHVAFGAPHHCVLRDFASHRRCHGRPA